MNRLAMAAAVFTVLTGTATALPPPFTFGSGQLNQPNGEAVAPSGDVYVADRANHRVVRFSRDGSLLNDWSEGALTSDVAADQTGVYAASQNGVSKHSPDGTLLWSTAVPAVYLTSDGNDVYVSDTNNPGAIRVLNASTGSVLATWSMPSGVNGGLTPRPGGGLYVHDWIAQRIASVLADGSIAGTFASPPARSGTYFVTTDNQGNVFTEEGCGYGSRVLVYAPSGALSAAFDKDPGAFPDGCFGGMGVSSDGLLYAALGSSGKVKVYDLWTPDTSLVASTDRPLTGKPLAFTATATIRVGEVKGYDWDLDGDGSFETTTSTPTATTTYARPGPRAVRVRATSSRGKSSTASLDVNAFTDPPAGEPGVTINRASPYTNNKKVSLGVVWPPFATGMRISNDGGFTSATTVMRPLAATQTWELEDSVKALYTKVVYVRFSGPGIDETKTYTDDIILDLTPPAIRSAVATRLSEAAETTKATGRPVRVRTRAKDNRSGVGVMQVTRSKTKPGQPIAYARSRTVRVTGSRFYLRVQDRAGNWSKWRTVQVSR